MPLRCTKKTTKSHIQFKNKTKTVVPKQLVARSAMKNAYKNLHHYRCLLIVMIMVVDMLVHVMVFVPLHTGFCGGVSVMIIGGTGVLLPPVGCVPIFRFLLVLW